MEPLTVESVMRCHRRVEDNADGRGLACEVSEGSSPVHVMFWIKVCGSETLTLWGQMMLTIWG